MLEKIVLDHKINSSSLLFLRVLFVVAVALAGAHPLLAWSPGTGPWISGTTVRDVPALGFVVDTTSRTDVLSFYHTVYAASENYVRDMRKWSVFLSDHRTGAQHLRDDVQRRINFFRALTGLSADIQFDSDENRMCQQAALVFSRKNQIRHDPPLSWTTGLAVSGSLVQLAAENSLLTLSMYGPPAIDGYMMDEGAQNQAVGHRRWLLYSEANVMGTGDIPRTPGFDIHRLDGSHFDATNVTWVVPKAISPVVPSNPGAAWPCDGYFPITFLPARWSFSYPGADFSGATVTMTAEGGSPVATTVFFPGDSGVGDNTLIWEPAELPSTISGDTQFNVTISNIGGTGVPPTQSYSVILFDPNVLNPDIPDNGVVLTSTSGGYDFTPIDGADGYQLRISRVIPARLIAGDSTPAQIVRASNGAYSFRGGSNLIHLAFSEFKDVVAPVLGRKRDFVPSATSNLVFYDLGRFATTTTTLNVEVSTDQGNTWTKVWSRHGVGLTSAAWDKSFTRRTVSLAAYAALQKAINIRFVLRFNNKSAVLQNNVNDGFFIDSVSLTNAKELVATKLVKPADTYFETADDLNAAIASAPFAVNTTYYLRLQAFVGNHGFGFGQFVKIAGP